MEMTKEEVNDFIAFVVIKRTLMEQAKSDEERDNIMIGYLDEMREIYDKISE